MYSSQPFCGLKKLNQFGGRFKLLGITLNECDGRASQQPESPARKPVLDVQYHAPGK